MSSDVKTTNVVSSFCLRMVLFSQHSNSNCALWDELDDSYQVLFASQQILFTVQWKKNCLLLRLFFPIFSVFGLNFFFFFFAIIDK